MGQTVTPETGADGDADGFIGLHDYGVWASNFGWSVEGESGADADENGYIGLEDYALWKNHFGESNASGSSESVPEPTTAVLVLMMCVGCFRSRL